MKTINRIAICTTMLFIKHTINAQEKWTLQKCVAYARANNISVKQQDIQARLSDLVYKQSKMLNYPTANYTTSSGYQFGRSVDPTTNAFTTSPIGFVNVGLQSGITLFNWFAIRNTIAANKYTNQADNALVNKLQDDVTLNVVAAYLQLLQSVMQQNIATVQLSQTKEQLNATQKKIAVGALPELNAAELAAQFASDSTALLITANTIELNMLQLKALLALDAATPFDVSTPLIEQIPLLPLSELEPALVYNEAIHTQPQQLANRYRMLAAQKNTSVTRANMYPTLAAFGGLQTGYSSATKYQVQPNGASTIINYPVGFVNIGTNNYTVFTPESIPAIENATWSRQFDLNFRQSVGVTINVPILNSSQAKTAWRRAQLTEENFRLQNQQDELTLKQVIYQAYQNGISAMQTFWARQKVAESSKYAYELGKKRYAIGLLPTYELLTLQNNASKDKINLLASQFDYVFKMKILEFYKGQGLKL